MHTCIAMHIHVCMCVQKNTHTCGSMHTGTYTNNYRWQHTCTQGVILSVLQWKYHIKSLGSRESLEKVMQWSQNEWVPYWLHFYSLGWGPVVLPQLASISWAQEILLPLSPKCLGLQVYAIAFSLNFGFLKIQDVSWICMSSWCKNQDNLHSNFSISAVKANT